MTRLLAVLAAFVLANLMGCAVNENTYWTVTDSDAYWIRSGYSIKPPSGSNWVKLPTDDKNPNSISFFKGEGVTNRGSTSDTYIFLKGTVTLANSTLIDHPVLDRTDKKKLAATLRKHLNRHWPIKIENSRYVALSRGDCLKYSGSSKIERPRIGMSDLTIEQVRGYFCLHPDSNSFGVIMESRNFVTTGSSVLNRDEDIDHFFDSLIFTSLSTVPGAR